MLPALSRTTERVLRARLPAKSFPALASLPVARAAARTATTAVTMAALLPLSLDLPLPLPLKPLCPPTATRRHCQLMAARPPVVKAPNPPKPTSLPLLPASLSPVQCCWLLEWPSSSYRRRWKCFHSISELARRRLMIPFICVYMHRCLRRLDFGRE